MNSYSKLQHSYSSPTHLPAARRTPSASSQEDPSASSQEDPTCQQPGGLTASHEYQKHKLEIFRVTRTKCSPLSHWPDLKISNQIKTVAFIWSQRKKFLFIWDQKSLQIIKKRKKNLFIWSQKGQVFQKFVIFVSYCGPLPPRVISFRIYSTGKGKGLLYLVRKLSFEVS